MNKSIIDFIINSVLISVPEESFVVAFVLIFMGKIEYLNLKKTNIIRFFIPVVLSAGISGFLRIVLQYGLDFIPFLGILIIFLSIVLIYEIKTFKKVMQCLACSIIGMIIPGLLQLAYVPVSMSIMRLTIDDINKVNLGVLCFTIPERVIEFLLIAVLFSKKKNLMRVNPLRIIINSKAMSTIFFTSIILNFIFVYILTYVIYMQKILTNLPIIMQLLSVMIIFIMPIVNIASIVGIVYLLAYREKTKRMYLVEETKAVSALISILSRRGNYNQIQDELKDFNQQIQEIDKKNVKYK